MEPFILCENLVKIYKLSGLEPDSPTLMKPMDPFIVCENLVKIYKVSGLEVVALQGLNLAVQPGELMGIVGASGSGKTVLRPAR
jgi:ABC-type bacteriocin/lantibiotic exporter with double-glycine peptidase domain